MPGTAGLSNRFIAATCALLLGNASGLAAQHRIAGVVLDYASRTPIPGVLVSAPRAPASQRTDAAGRFVLTLAAGTHIFELTHPGYQAVTVRRLINAPTVAPMEFVMTAARHSAPTSNPGEDAVAEWPPGLKDRVGAGGGVFLLEGLLRALKDSSLASIIVARAPMLEVTEEAGRRLLASRSGHLSADRCYLAVTLNGAQVWEPAPARQPGRPSGARPPTRPGLPPDVDQWNPAGLQAVEIYPAGRVPTEFASPGMHCGAVFLWSRSGRPQLANVTSQLSVPVSAPRTEPAPSVVSTQSRVHGTIRDTTQGTPLPLVEVLVEELNLSTRTDAQGRYSLIVPLGFHTILFRQVGYHPVTRRLRLSSDDPLQFDLAMLSAVQRLDSVLVVAPERPSIWPPGIEDRKKEGFGTFIADSILRRFDHSTLPIVLGSRANAVRFIRVQGRQVAIQRRGDPMGKDCAMSVWRDGILLHAGGPYSPVSGRRITAGNSQEPPDLGRIGIVGLTEIEVYNMATLPSQFRAGSGRCGAIVIWSRHSLSPDGERP